MPYRASLRQDSGPLSPRTSGKTASAGSRTLSKVSSAVTEARNESLRPILWAEKPGVSVGTTKPRIPSSVWAQTTATAARVPLVIHIFEPLSTHSSPSSLARVFIDPGSEPASGSVRPKQPSFSPVAIEGSQVSLWAEVPHRWIANIASDPCTDTKDRRPESTASSSRHATPYAVALMPAHP